jgi:hypothetical protein
MLRIVLLSSVSGRLSKHDEFKLECCICIASLNLGVAVNIACYVIESCNGFGGFQMG